MRKPRRNLYSIKNQFAALKRQKKLSDTKFRVRLLELRPSLTRHMIAKFTANELTGLWVDAVARLSISLDIPPSDLVLASGIELHLEFNAERYAKALWGNSWRSRLAERSGLAAGTLRDYVRPRHDAEWARTLVAIATVLDVQPGDLLGEVVPR